MSAKNIDYRQIWRSFSDLINSEFLTNENKFLLGNEVNLKIKQKISNGYVIWKGREKKVYAEFAEKRSKTTIGIYLNYDIQFELSVKRFNWFRYYFNKLILRNSKYYFIDMVSSQKANVILNDSTIDKLMSAFYWSNIEFKRLEGERSVIGITSNMLISNIDELSRINEFRKFCVEKLEST